MLSDLGFNLGKPKRFTAPTLTDGMPFEVRPASGGAAAFTGKISGHIGDFSAFDPANDPREFVVVAGLPEQLPHRDVQAGQLADRVGGERRVLAGHARAHQHVLARVEGGDVRDHREAGVVQRGQPAVAGLQFGVQRTGQGLEKIQADTERDYFMSADEAASYGLIDQVIAKRP